ncbi:MAG: WXG100 family type VII secretion target [Pseudonocardiales bacterium]
MGVLPGFEVTTAQLQAASVQLDQIGAEVRSELSRLGTEAGGLLDGGWRGQAAVGFQRGWAQWSAGACEVLDALDAMARLLASTGQGYDMAEDDSSRTVAWAGGQL